MARPFREYHLFQLLRRFDNQHLPLDLFLSHYFRAHRAIGSKDRLFIVEAVYGIIRWKSLLDHLAEGHPSWEKRYRIYQNFQPYNYLRVNTIPLHIRLSFPEELTEVLLEEFGEEETIRLGQVSSCSAPIAVRVNPLKCDRQTLMQKWEGLFEISEGYLSPYAILFKKRTPLTSLPEFKEGLFEIQDEASQHVADLIEAKPGDHVLDYCAGAGGKTLAFAHKTEGKGQIYLHDIRPIILDRAKKRLKRAGIQNAQYTADRHKLKPNMDWILVDAPCTGTGTYRRNPDQKWKFTKKQLERVVLEQREIFANALKLLKPGGKIVYATCSLLKKENEEQVEYFMKKYSLELVREPFRTHYCLGYADALFGAVLQNVSSTV
ncbi:MAG: RsmB/NOP family class I SAM-dependent RNA methyltransferase [Chlamydiales bacterium]|nr:RsmB/NOP family class I SAM-dependent RNA methyltransferase [Chlamydiales bacterium]